MTLISRIKTNTIAVIFAIIFLFLSCSPAHAQESLTLSISPSLFDMSVNPGQEWRSNLRIINVNKYDLTVYVDVVNFRPQGEGGDGKFVPVDPVGADGSTVAEWFSISREAITIPREQSLEVPFAVKVPQDAGPGGHFAAILVGTKPIVGDSSQTKVQTAQMVTSLFFARVAGDINELGTIREFTTTSQYLNSPEADFELRFENKGNVHLQPQGEIVITNMWGHERGTIPINHASQFGNVLPESIRKFNFSWKGEWSMSDIGRYSAVATLAYGTESRQFTSSKIYFWVIPYKLLFGVFLSLALFIFVITWLVRLYVRKMLEMAGIDVNDHKAQLNKAQNIKVEKKTRGHIYLPILAGLNDLKQRMRMTISFKQRLQVFIKFVFLYKIFFGALVFICFSIFIVYTYISNANTGHRGFEIAYVNSDAEVKLTSEEIIYNQLKSERNISEPILNGTLPKIALVNRSGVPGLGAEIKIRLQSLGYEIVSLEADFTSVLSRTVIVSTSGSQEDSLRLSSRLDNALISASDDATDGIITVYLADDIELE